MFGLFRGCRNLARLVRIGVTLARHDALFPAAALGDRVTGAALLLHLTRLLRRRGQSRQAEWSAAIPPVRLRYRARSSPAAATISASALCDGKRRMLSTR